MISNLKVDIIYYKTSSDFELEFNLSGCCRMRIFKEKVENQKALINTLARDVSRSRVIIVVTDLLGEKNGVEIVSSAIGYTYEPVDKLANSIKSGDDIKAPRGSLPLVTKSGQYGGCIVECGKQSIIIVTSERALRHEVMRSYIHQYIFDINQVEAYNERLRHESEHNPIIDQSNILNSARKEFMPATADIQSAEEGSSDNVNEQNNEALTATDPSEAETAASIEKDTVAEDNTTADDSTATVDASEIAPSEEAEAADKTVIEPTEAVVQDTTDDIKQDAKGEPETRTEDAVIRSSSEGFVAMISDTEDKPTVKAETNSDPDRRLHRRKNGTNVTLLVIAILLLVCFGLLSYYFVYLPIVGGELPNDLSKIISEVLPWTE